MRPARIDRRRALLGAALVLAAAGGAALVWSLPGAERPVDLPWWVLAPAFAAAGVPVRLVLRGRAHPMTSVEVPLVAGALLASPAALLAGVVLGAAVADAVSRQPRSKRVPNLATEALGAVLVIAAVELAGRAPATDPLAGAAVLAAVALGSALAGTSAMAHLALDEGRLPQGLLREALPGGVALSVVLGAIGLAFAAVVVPVPVLVFAVPIPALLLVLALRAFIRGRSERRRLELLLVASRSLARAGDVVSALEALLQEAVSAIGATRGEVVLAGHDGVRRIVRLPGGRVEHLAGSTRALQALLPADGAELRDGERPRTVAVAPLPGGSGVVLVADPRGLHREFSDDDLRLLDALAAQAGVALDLDRAGQDVDRLVALEARLRHQAMHDPLTGLANRELLVRELARAGVDGEAVAVVYLDLDDFKTVNDSLGHAAGDELLGAVAGRLRRALRDGDLPARLGGDEFAVLVRPGDAGEAVARRVLAALSAPFAVSGTEVVVRASAGVAAVAAGEPTGRLLRQADLAMYAAKREDQGGVASFAPAMQAQVDARHGLKGELVRALAQDELRLDFQPIVDLRTGDVRAVEALLRWEHPTRGVVGPSAFVPLGEETGLIVPITRWVLDAACTAAADWPEIELHVNVSRRDLREPDLSEALAAILVVSGLPAERLVLELTERGGVLDDPATRAGMDAVRALGVRLAIDDFGAGASSLTELRDTPFDVLKLDRSFVDDARGERVFIPAILDIARALGVEAIVEGVEDPAQAARLRAAGCRLGQGFALARPMAASEVAELLPEDGGLAHGSGTGVGAG